MTMKNKMKKNLTGLILILFGTLLILAGIIPVFLLPSDVFEYVIPAPALSAESPVKKLTEELSSTLEGYEWSVAFRIQNAEVSLPGTTSRQPVCLYAVGEGYFDQHHETLLSGRYITGDDIRENRKVAVVNQHCAFSLYPGSDPIGQTLVCNEIKLEIVGVTKEDFRPGETTDYMIWVPSTLTETEKLNALTLEVRIRSGSHSKSIILKNLLQQWIAGGSVHDFSRLRLEALMPLWFIGAVSGFLVMKYLIRLTIRTEKKLFRSYRLQLETRYPDQLKLFLLRTILLGAGVIALLLCSVYLYLSYIVFPFYTFTDWIPEAFVDPKAIATTIRNLLTGASPSTLYLSANAAAFRIYSAWITAGTLFFSTGIAIRLLIKALPSDKCDNPSHG